MNKGFTLIEILISIALIALILPAISILLSFSTQTTSQGEKYSQAKSLAQEQMEAIHYLKNSGTTQWDWITTPTNTSPNEYYQPQLVSGVWQLGSLTLAPIESQGFTKTVQVGEVRRCGMAICELGAIDDDSRKINVNVSWKERGEEQNISLESIVTKY